MKPLLEIQSVPISVEYKINPARLELDNSMAQVEVSKNRGGLTIRSKPIKINIDTFEARGSVSPTPRQSVENFAAEGRQAAYQATARYAEEGGIYLDIHLDQDPVNIITENRQNANTPQFGLGFIPSAPADITWTPAEFTLKYEMDKLSFDWRTGSQNEFKFIPGNIEFSIKEYNRVIFTYVGDPIYVPPSANPNYQPIDELV